MSLETERSIERENRRRSRESGREQESNREDKDSAELKRAAAKERAEYLAHEVKSSKQTMQNIVQHMQQVMAAIAKIRAELNLVSSQDLEEPVSVRLDKSRIDELRKKISAYQSELVAMRHELVRGQMEELKNGIGVGLSTAALERRAEEMVDELINKVIKE